MINPFPELLTFHLLAPVLLRITLGVFIFKLGISKIQRPTEILISFFESLGLKPGKYALKSLGWTEICMGTLLIVGLMTQIAAFIVAIICFVSIIVSTRHEHVGLYSPSYYVLLFVISISLVFTGAGLIAIDLPL